MHKTDPNYDKTMASKNTHGVVGENAIWDGPLDQLEDHTELVLVLVSQACKCLKLKAITKECQLLNVLKDINNVQFSIF